MLRLVRTVLLVVIGAMALSFTVALVLPGNMVKLIDDVEKHAHSPHVVALTWASFAFSLACCVMMLLLGLNASFLRDRLFTRTIAGVLYLGTIASGAAAIGLGFAAATAVGQQVTGGLLPAIVCFVVISVLAPGFLGRGAPATTGVSGPTRRVADDAVDAPPPRPKSRQRRGGRR